MNVKILPDIPDEWKNKKPIRSYETRFLYIGLRRLDTFKKTLSMFQYTEKGLVYHEEPFPDIAISRLYSTELATVSVYSESPRVWVEELSPHERYVYTEV